MKSTQLIGRVNLRRSLVIVRSIVYLKPNEPARVLSNEKVEEALSSGVEVSSIHWDELDGIASEFLLSEEILDAP